MKIRIITSLIGLPILVALLIVGGIYLQLAVLVISIIGMFEMYNALNEKMLPVHYIAYIFATIYILGLGRFFEDNYQIFYIMLIVTIMFSMVFFHNICNIKDCAVALFGFFYVPMLMSNIFLVRIHDYGEIFVWLIFIAAWGCDTGAYFVGKAFGKHKLAPKLSAKKTVEGSIGGIITAALMGALFAIIISNMYDIHYLLDMPVIILSAVLCAVGSVFSQLGDLTASAIKRYSGIKDFGSIFPGHGGVLDRFDSILITSPGIYVVILLLH